MPLQSLRDFTTLSQSLKLPPEAASANETGLDLHIPMATHTNPKRLKNHLQYSCFMMTHLSKCSVSDMGFNTPPRLYDGLASVTASRLSKLCFCVCFLNMHSTRYGSE